MRETGRNREKQDSQISFYKSGKMIEDNAADEQTSANLVLKNSDELKAFLQ